MRRARPVADVPGPTEAESAGGTRAVFIERYSTLMGRDVSHDSDAQRLASRSLERCLGPWFPKDKDAAILDAGCGEGRLLTILRRQGYRRLSGFDVSPENVAICSREGLDFVGLHDVRSLASFEREQHYRVVFLVDLIEHLSKDEAVPLLRSVRERLVPGGYVVIRTPNMGSLLGALGRYGDLTHEWGMTEQSAVHLLTAAGFNRAGVEVAAAWEAATPAGRARERYLRLLHRMVFLAAGKARPRIATPNLLVRAVAP